MTTLAKGRQFLATRSSRERLGPKFKVRQLSSTKVKRKADDLLLEIDKEAELEVIKFEA